MEECYHQNSFSKHASGSLRGKEHGPIEMWGKTPKLHSTEMFPHMWKCHLFVSWTCLRRNYLYSCWNQNMDIIPHKYFFWHDKLFSHYISAKCSVSHLENPENELHDFPCFCQKYLKIFKFGHQAGPLFEGPICAGANNSAALLYIIRLMCCLNRVINHFVIKALCAWQQIDGKQKH